MSSDAALPSPAAGVADLASKGFYFVVMLGMMVLPIIIIPVETQNPTVHSKELALRFLLGCGLVLAVLAVPAWPRRRLDLPQVAILGFAAAGFLSSAASGNPGFSFHEAWQVFGMPILALLAYRADWTSAQMRKLLIVVVAAAVFTAVYGLAVYFGFDFLRRLYPFSYKKDEARNFVHSFLGNPEYFGGYMAPVAVLCVAQAFRQGTGLAGRAAWAAATLFFLVALMLSGTRGAAIGFIAGTSLMIWKLWPALPLAARRSLRGVVTVVVILGAVVFTIFSFPNPLNRRDMRLAGRFVSLFDLTTPSMRERILFFSIAGTIIAEDPVLGSGPATFQLNFYPSLLRLQDADSRAGVLMMTRDLKGGVADHAHNDYLEFWSDTGTLGYGALVFVLCVALVRFVRVRPRDADPGDVHLMCAYFGAASCIFLNAAFSFPLHLPVRGTLAWIGLACFLTCARRAAGTRGAELA